jgi:hypothetical protein
MGLDFERGLLEMTNKFLVEFEIVGRYGGLYRLDDNFIWHPIEGERHHFTYTVLATPHAFASPIEGFADANRVVFDSPEAIRKVQRVIWALADLCAPANYWILSDLTLTDLREFANTGALSKEFVRRLEQLERVPGRQWPPLMLAQVTKHQDLPISPQSASTSHILGFRFFALPPDSESNLVLSLAVDDYLTYRYALEALRIPGHPLYDSVFEVFPYEDEECNHVAITLSPTLTREQVRQVVKEVYHLPYVRVKVTKQEFDRWEATAQADFSKSKIEIERDCGSHSPFAP